jgi:cyclopropane fatty-acyl-phospholipid synthase-like methyltransferase
MTKTAERYSNTADAQVFLDRGSPAYLGGTAEFLCDSETAGRTIGSLADCVRKGGTIDEQNGAVTPNHAMWVKFARGMAPLMMPAAQFMAGQIPAQGAAKVLDIAAGHGMFGIMAAKRNPQAQVVALDWPAVLEVAKEHAAEMGVADRYQTIPGSAFEVNWGGDYDAVLLPNFLHHFDLGTCDSVIGKAYSALKPGGKLLVLEFVPDADRTTPPNVARFAVTMLCSTPSGNAHTFEDYRPLLDRAGFRTNEIRRLETQQSVIVSVK